MTIPGIAGDVASPVFLFQCSAMFYLSVVGLGWFVLLVYGSNAFCGEDVKNDHREEKIRGQARDDLAVHEYKLRCCGGLLCLATQYLREIKSLTMATLAALIAPVHTNGEMTLRNVGFL